MSVLRTMILDDHPTFRKSLRNLLKRFDYVQLIGEAGSGEEALKALEEQHPHLVIADIQLKGMSGFDFARVLVQKFPKTQVVFVTLYNTVNNRSEAARMGFPYIPKESLLEELPRVLEKIKVRVDVK